MPSLNFNLIKIYFPPTNFSLIRIYCYIPSLNLNLIRIYTSRRRIFISSGHTTDESESYQYIHWRILLSSEYTIYTFVESESHQIILYIPSMNLNLIRIDIPPTNVHLIRKYILPTNLKLMRIYGLSVDESWSHQDRQYIPLRRFLILAGYTVHPVDESEYKVYRIKIYSPGISRRRILISSEYY